MVGGLLLPRVDGPAWMNGAIVAVLAVSLVPLLWSSLSLTRLVAEFLRSGLDD